MSEIKIPCPESLNDRDLKNIVELGISWNYLLSDARGNRDNMLAYLEELDQETWEQLYLKYTKE